MEKSHQTPITELLFTPIIKKGLNVGFIRFWKITRIVGRMPYPARWCYWVVLYFYNKWKFPSGQFTLDDYKLYAKYP